MYKRWELKERPDNEVVMELSKALNINRRLASLLIQRDIENFDDAKNFFRPQMEHLHDPFLMKDMDKAVARIQKATDKGEKIMVYGDYDVDGTTAVSCTQCEWSLSHGNGIGLRKKRIQGRTCAGDAEENELGLVHSQLQSEGQPRTGIGDRWTK